MASERARALERSSRYLMLNSPKDIEDLQQVLTTIVTNIVSNPIDPRFRVLKLNNKLVQTKIAHRKGGFEFLQGLGFESVEREGERTLVLTGDGSAWSVKIGESVPLSAEVTAHLLAMLDWLNDNVAVCLEYAAARSFPSGSFASVSPAAAASAVCAECVIQLKLPISSGVCVEGGFGSTEPVSSLAAFARAHFTAERGETMLLRHAHDASVLEADGEAGARTLQEAGLCPRAKLLATLQSDPGRGQALQAAKAAVSEDAKQTAAKAEAARKAKMAEAEKRKLERDRTISSFKEDRADFRQQGR